MHAAHTRWTTNPQNREVSRAVDRESGETVAIKKMSITLPGEANAKEGVRACCVVVSGTHSRWRRVACLSTPHTPKQKLNKKHHHHH